MDLMGTRSVWELIHRRAEATPDTAMLLSDDREPFTFGDLARYAERVAAGLQREGVIPGSTVAWQLPTSHEAIVLWAALARLGCRQVPLLVNYRAREIGFVLRQTAAQAILTVGEWEGTDHNDLVRSTGIDVQVIDVFHTPLDREPDGLPPEPAAAPDEERWIYYTSGTTADPKGVRHTDGTLLAGGEAMADALGMTPDDVGSIAFPFAHIAGPDYVLAMLVVGFPAVLLPRFDPRAAVETYRRHGVTMAGGSTAFYQALLAVQRDDPGTPMLPTLRLLSGGGAAMAPAIFHAVRAELGVPVLHGYAMTEVAMGMMGRPGDPDELLATTAGRPVRGLEIRIVGPDERELPEGVEGEIRLRGTVVSPGYTDPALDVDAFDAQGWLRSGDLGKLVGGRLVVTGRIKDIIIRKGENISALEVEHLAATHPSIRDVAVIGVPDEERGELVCAVVELEPGASLTLPDMVAHLRAAGIMAQKLPERLEVIDAMPRGATLGKVLKSELRARFAG